MERTKIIIDTDIGDDIDDALAIAFALESPELDVLGITTVFRNVTARAKIAVRLLEQAGRADIPVHAGIGSPILNKADVNEIPNQYDEARDGAAAGFGADGIDFIVETIMASDGDITLVPIGPLTNIAIAILREPALRSKVKEIVMMGGCFYSHLSEWNIEVRPGSRESRVRIGHPDQGGRPGRDGAMRPTQGRRGPVDDKPETSAAYLPDLLARWRKVSDHEPMLHDPLAVCAVFDDRLLAFQQDDIVVETQGEHTRGQTYNRSALYWRGNADRSVIRAAKHVDSAAFLKLYMDRVCH